MIQEFRQQVLLTWGIGKLLALAGCFQLSTL